MKLIFLILSLYIFVSVSVFAQRNFSIGVCIGTGYSIQKTELSNPLFTFNGTSVQAPAWIGIHSRRDNIGRFFVGADIQYSSLRFRIADISNKTLFINRYHYIGISPYAGLRVTKWLGIVGAINLKTLLSSQTFFVNQTRSSLTYFSPRINIKPVANMSIDVGYEHPTRNFASIAYYGNYSLFYNSTIFFTIKYDIFHI